MDERYIERLMATIKCGVCGQRYNGGDIKILGHRDDLWFLSVSCPACHSRGLVAAVLREERLPELVTDLTEEEFAKFSDAESVSVDDVLDMYNFLKRFDGDLSSLFSQ